MAAIGLLYVTSGACTTTHANDPALIHELNLDANCRYKKVQKANDWTFIACDLRNLSAAKQTVTLTPSLDTSDLRLPNQTEFDELKALLKQSTPDTAHHASPIGGGVGIIFQVVSALSLALFSNAGESPELFSQADLKPDETVTFYFPFRNEVRAPRLDDTVLLEFSKPKDKSIRVPVRD